MSGIAVKQQRSCCAAAASLYTLLAPDWISCMPGCLLHGRVVLAQVLRFFGFFLESVVESNIENHRVRVSCQVQQC
jgi:hypothetical protein